MIVRDNQTPKPVVGREYIGRSRKQASAAECGFDGSNPDEAGVRGEILTLSDPKSTIARASHEIADILIGVRGDKDKAKGKLPFGFKVGR